VGRGDYFLSFPFLKIYCCNVKLAIKQIKKIVLLKKCFRVEDGRFNKKGKNMGDRNFRNEGNFRKPFNGGEFNPNISVGEIYSGKVAKILQSGAFIELTESPKKDGFVHISQLRNERVEKVEDVLEVGKTYKFKLIGFDFSRKPKLSLKAVNQETGEDIENYVKK
jgi:predicted RNA-binding protein with RPS1 domain